MNFKELMLQKNFIILDGGMGTAIQKSGLQTDGVPEELNITNPDAIIAIHRSFIDAGSDIIYTNTFGANACKIKNSTYSVEQLVTAGVKNARTACQGTNALVALDVGSTGQLLEPTGYFSFDEAYDVFKEQIIAGKDADLIVIETMTDLTEIRAAVLAAKENSDLPIICTMSFEKNMRTFTGCSVSAAALTLQGLGVDALGINCSLGADEMYPLIEELSKYTYLPIVVKPNAGLPDPKTGAYSITAEKFAEQIADLIPLGIRITGGCCGTTPDFIRAISNKLASKSPNTDKHDIPCAVCSSTKTVIINRPTIIGERLNPTGKKILKEALVNHNIDYILRQATEQVDAGAEILDLNVGIPGVDEKSLMLDVLKELQCVVDAPIQIDSSSPDVIEATLRRYSGKAIVNSVNGKEESLNSILPLVKKYGAAVVALTLDENGIPKTCAERLKIAEKIISRATALGIPEQDIFVDCLTLTVSAEQDAVFETLNALHTIKQKYKCKTVLGVSNISFGLPSREKLNSTFLTAAMTLGLDLPIMNPNDNAMASAVRAFRVLNGSDAGSIEYINSYANISNTVINKPTNTSSIDLTSAIIGGYKTEAAQLTQQMLETTDSMQIVDMYLIPALDKVGADFESGKTFLPQLIMSATTAQAAFDVIKKHLSATSSGSISKGKIILATVKGDIHDIGKNIVKVLLENYGYTVIDLGKDVDSMKIVRTAIELDIKLVGLSALMTTTLKSMEEAIRLLRENNVDCKVMVGGAVVTEDYAKSIGADYYSENAKCSVDIAREVFGC
ncbi:MAG: homocysteine S-methyltransferase family protein [Acutalibacteraceae bacterium]